MFSLNLTPTPLLSVDFGGATPRTPEIVNSLMAMTNPLEYSYSMPSQVSLIVITYYYLSFNPFFYLWL